MQDLLLQRVVSSLWCSDFSLVVACRFFLSLVVAQGLQRTWAL